MIAKRAMTTMAEEEEDTGQLLPLPPPPREAKTKRMDTILAAQKGGCKSIPKPAAATTGVTRQAGDHYREFSFKGERFDDSRCRRNTVVKENESEREGEGGPTITDQHLVCTVSV